MRAPAKLLTLITLGIFGFDSPIFLSAYALENCPQQFEVVASRATPKDFQAQTVENFREAAEGLNEQESYFFLARSGNAESAGALTASMRAEPSAMRDLPSLLTQTNTAHLIELASAPGYGTQKGGMVIWKNNIFPADFVARRFDQLNKTGSASAISFSHALQETPWFEWNEAKNSFTLHRKGASGRLLSLIQGSSPDSQKIQLYRGTGPLETTLLKHLQAHTQGKINAAWKEETTQAMNAVVEHHRETAEAWNQLFIDKLATEAEAVSRRSSYLAAKQELQQTTIEMAKISSATSAKTFLENKLGRTINQSRFFGEFVTPNADRAALFSKGHVLEFETTFADLKALLNQGQLVIGFEKMVEAGGRSLEIEIGLFGGRSPEQMSKLTDLLVKSLKRSTNVEPGNLFN